MSQPKWQRGRIVGGEPAHRRGDYVWAKAGGPELVTWQDSTGEIGTSSMLRISIVQPNGTLSAALPKYIELLPEFADDVPMIPLADFLREETRH